MNMQRKRFVGSLAAMSRRLGLEALTDSSGVAAVEFAVILPVLMVLTMGMIDFSMYIGTRMELEQAVRAGGQYALKDSSDSVTIASAVTGSTSLSGVTVNVGSLVCECPNGTSTVCRGDVNYASCAGGLPPAGFLTITATTTYDPIFANSEWFSAGMSVQQELTMQVN